MDEDEFIKGRMKRLQEIAADADPFVKKRLLRLAENYERRLQPPKTPPTPAVRDTETPPKR
ncbi:MAG: hypothetical protein GY844_23580 [Bradyrhizobium sp.]|nr:hypothetical protein [Bradyrhizobium sp.]